jgi:NADPH:quinone reductase-like Zn-dependent oxidoreductase
VFDLIGGETQDRSWQVLKRGGILVSTLGQPPEEKADAHGARGVGYLATPNAAELADIGRLIDEGKVRPVIDAIFPFARVTEAEQHLEEAHVQGKIVLEAAT